MSTRSRIMLAAGLAVFLLALYVGDYRARNRKYDELADQVATMDTAATKKLGELQDQNNQNLAARDKMWIQDINALARATNRGLNAVYQAAEAELRKADEAWERRLADLKAEFDAQRATDAARIAALDQSVASNLDLRKIQKDAESVVFVDVYGTFTDEGYYLTPNGIEYKRFKIDGAIAHLTAFVLEPQADGSDGDYQYLATAGHIKDNKVPIKELWCKFRDDLNLPSEKVELAGYDHRYDLALLRFRKGFKFPGKTFRLGNSDTLQTGDKVVALGCPLDAEYTITEGEVMDVDHVGVTKGAGAQPRLQIHSAQTTFGNSGGPLILKRTGEVVGVNVMLEDAPGGYFLSTPVNDLRDMYPRLKNTRGSEVLHSQLEHAAFVNSWRFNPPDWTQIGVKPILEHCVVCTEVLKDSVADKSGLKAGDIVLEWNGVVPKDDADLWRMITNIVPGTAVGTMKVRREAETLTLRLPLGIFKGQVLVHRRYKVEEIK